MVPKSVLYGLAGLLVAGGAAPALARESDALNLARQLNQAFIEVAEAVSPSVVVISVAHKPEYAQEEMESNPLWEYLPPELRKRMQDQYRERSTPRSRGPVFDGQGSGMIIREDGYILTNGHVVEGADRIRVRFSDGREFPAEVRGVDEQSDVAVIRVEARDLPAIRFADSDKVKVGEFAIAIGAPLELDYSVTFGHVSAKGRSVIPDPAMDQDFIQTDANINPGNSGGPLVNIDGEVMGINTLIRGLRTGIGFAIPSNIAREVATQLIDEGKFTRAWLGIQINALKEDRDYQKMVQSVKDGVVVRGIIKGGPSDNSELRLGDVITAVEGRPVTTAQQLRKEVRTRKVGSPILLDVVRGDQEMKVTVTSQAWPEETTPAVARRESAATGRATDLGITVRPATKELAKEMEIEFEEGVVVTDVDEGSLAAERGIRPGDTITELNHERTITLRQFREASAAADTKKGVVVNLVREGVSQFVILKEAAE